jgi:hypothetical protein
VNVFPLFLEAPGAYCHTMVLEYSSTYTCTTYVLIMLCHNLHVYVHVSPGASKKRGKTFTQLLFLEKKDIAI